MLDCVFQAAATAARVGTEAENGPCVLKSAVSLQCCKLATVVT
jgi:hypothetical protein